MSNLNTKIHKYLLLFQAPAETKENSRCQNKNKNKHITLKLKLSTSDARENRIPEF